MGANRDQITKDFETEKVKKEKVHERTIRRKIEPEKIKENRKVVGLFL